MRIAVVLNVLPPEGRGGAEAYAALLAATLAEEHDVLVLSTSPTGEVGTARLARLPGLPHLAPTASLSEKLIWHSRDQWRPSVQFALRRELRSFRPDVVHTHECQGLSAAVFTAISSLGLRHVHTAHDLNLLCARTSMTRDFEFCGGRCGFCRVQRVIRGGAFRRLPTDFIAISDFILRRHVEAGIVDIARAQVIRHGSATGRPRLREPRDGGLRVGFIGTLEPHKGLPTLLQAFADPPPGWHLTIAGSGSLAALATAAAAEQPRISYLGYIAGDEKERFFDELDVLVIPSEWEEPAALVGTEAAARAIPLIASDRGGIPELPEATVFPARDARALRETIAAFAAAPDRLQAISGRLLERHDEFTWSTHVAKIERLLLQTNGR
jgi:glycosyltransferase involved in cell wall biosynthesis